VAGEQNATVEPSQGRQLGAEPSFWRGGVTAQASRRHVEAVVRNAVTETR
jgi:hypothetical protein